MLPKSLEDTKKAVWPIIENYLKDSEYPKQFKISRSFKKEIDKYWEINKTYPLRQGKYIRPTLVRLIAKSLGVKNMIKVNQIAAAMQLSEEWILIHDDVEDKSDTRRNGPTLHKLYGQELAINSGDSLQILMWKAVYDVGSDNIYHEFVKMLSRTVTGQAIEEMWKRDKSFKLTKESYFVVADSKSGYYSIAGPMRLGAIAAKADERTLDVITNLGLHMGRCFQLKDDILDYEQDKKDNQKTIATQLGLDVCSKMAEEERQKAIEIFEKETTFFKNNKSKAELREMIDFIANRDH